MKQYYITKEKYNGEVVYLNYNKLNGYKITPKNIVPYEGVRVNEMIIIKPSLIEKIIKRKIKLKLDSYLKYIISIIDGNNSDDDTRRALDDLQRYRILINQKYAIYLDDKYLSLLNRKMDVLEREFKTNLAYSSLSDYQEENKKSR